MRGGGTPGHLRMTWVSGGGRGRQRLREGRGGAVRGSQGFVRAFSASSRGRALTLTPGCQPTASASQHLLHFRCLPGPSRKLQAS